MRVGEGRIWTELRKLRESEATLQAMFLTLHAAGIEKEMFFMDSLRRLNGGLRVSWSVRHELAARHHSFSTPRGPSAHLAV